jgi:hypothetical protein
MFGKTRSKSKSLARIGVADGGHEEAQAKGQHDDVQHGILLGRACQTRFVGTRPENHIVLWFKPRTNPALSSGPEVPSRAYVFEATAEVKL